MRWGLDWGAVGSRGVSRSRARGGEDRRGLPSFAQARLLLFSRVEGQRVTISTLHMCVAIVRASITLHVRSESNEPPVGTPRVQRDLGKLRHDKRWYRQRGHRYSSGRSLHTIEIMDTERLGPRSHPSRQLRAPRPPFAAGRTDAWPTAHALRGARPSDSTRSQPSARATRRNADARARSPGDCTEQSTAKPDIRSTPHPAARDIRSPSRRPASRLHDTGQSHGTR